jgi:hypothetical protein
MPYMGSDVFDEDEEEKRLEEKEYDDSLDEHLDHLERLRI